MRSRWRELWIVMVAIIATFVGALPAHAWDEVWEPMAGGMNSSVRATAVFDGGLIAGGDFTTAGGQAANRIARWNGGAWQSFASGMNDSVLALTVYNGELIAGGRFTTADGISANRIARWNGSAWQPLGDGMDDEVSSLTVYNGELIAGGAFITAGGISANRIARWNSTSWQPLGSGMSGGTLPAVHALHIFNNELIAGGTFTVADGVTVNRIARWNGSVWQSLSSGFTGGFGNPGVFALTEYNGELIAGGDIFGLGPVGPIARWTGAVWQNLGSGLPLLTSVYALTEYNGELVVGGSFTSTVDVPGTNRIARWNGTEWQPPLGVGMDEPIRTLVNWNDALVAGGDFPMAGGQTVNSIAITTANSTQASCAVWQTVGGGFNASSSALEIYNGDLIAGGIFTIAGGVAANRIARWDGSNWHALGTGMVANPPSFTPRVRALTVYNNQLIAGGDFTNAGGVANTRYIARWNGTTWQSLGTGMGGTFPNVYSLAVYNGELIAGGTFTTAGGVTANGIARWNGSTWQNLGSGAPSSIISGLGVYGIELIACGGFTTISGVPANLIARWNGSVWQPLGNGFNAGAVYSVMEFNGELIAGGTFSATGGVPVNRIARWDGAAWHALGAGMNNWVEALVEFDGDLIAGGAFTSPANRIARWTGTTWEPLSSGVNDTVGDIIQYDGAMIIVGGFTTAGGGAGTANVARWSPNIWLNPQSGAFSDTRNWESGFFPGSPVLFGASSSLTPFTVTLRSFVECTELCVGQQSPILNLGGNQFDVVNQTAIGGAQTASLTVDNGTLASPLVDVGSFGTIGGNGSIGGSLFSVGTVRPGDASLSDGSLSLTGNFTQTFGTFNSRISAAQYGRLDVSNSASIAGTLKVELVGTPSFVVDQQFPVLTCGGTLAGTFDVALLPLIGDDLVMNVQYSSGAGGGASGGGTDGSGGVTIIIAIPNGNPDFGEPDTFTLEGEPTGVTGAVITNLPAARDLALSVAAPNPLDPGNALILLNQGDGTAFDPIVIPVGHEPRDIVSANLSDGAAADDLAIPNRGDDNVTVMFHEGAGSYALLNVAVGDAPSAIATEDFRGLGRNDLAVTNSGGDSVTILLNNGDRTFTALPAVNVGAQPHDIAAAPLVGSALSDLVVANFASNSITILENQGNGMFFPVNVIPVGMHPIHVTPADVDGDRDLDIIVSNQGSHSISLVRNLGAGQFSPVINLPLDGAPDSLEAWDMDDDGDIDIAAVIDHDTLGPVIQVLRNDSTPGPPTQIAFTLMNPIGQGEEPRLVNGTDVTGDALEDLVAVNVTTLPLNGGGGSLAGPPRSNSLTIRPTLLGIPGDVNGDQVVNIDDLVLIITSWGPCIVPANCPADVNHNGVVDIDDLVIVITHWG